MWIPEEAEQPAELPPSPTTTEYTTRRLMQGWYTLAVFGHNENPQALEQRQSGGRRRFPVAIALPGSWRFVGRREGPPCWVRCWMVRRVLSIIMDADLQHHFAGLSVLYATEVIGPLP